MERLRTNIVPHSGPLGAKLCGIGQAPGEEEDVACEPFIGQAGQFLRRCMAQTGIVPSHTLLYNLFVQRPPKNDVKYFFENYDKLVLSWEGQEHLENLRKWLEGLDPRPNLLIAFGKEAMWALTGKRRIWKWRGSVLPCTLVPGYKVYCSLHPSGVLRLLNEPEQKLQGQKKEYASNALPLFLRDLERAQWQSSFPEIRYPKRNFELDLSLEQILQRFEWMNDENIDASVDIETLYGPRGWVLWMIGFSPSPDKAFTVFFIRQGKLAWPLVQEAQILRAISEWFLNPRAKKIFHYGAQYDLPFLGRYYGLRVANGSYDDTMWLHQTSYPMIKKDLATCTSIYTWEPYYKDEGKVVYGRRGGDLAEGTYNCKDDAVTREIWPVTRKNAMDLHTLAGYQRQMTRVPSLLGMMLRGVRIDIEKKTELQKLFAAQVKFYEKQIWDLEGEQINLNSAPQKVKLLYYKHNFETQINRKTGNPTTDKDAIHKLKRKYPNEPLLDLLLEYQKYSKLDSTYTKMQVDEDGRIHTTYGWISTWRCNSSESPFGGGGNLQNIPIRTEEGNMIRELFISDLMEPYSGEEWQKVLKLCEAFAGPEIASKLVNGQMVWGKVDLSQAEARIVAWESNDMRRIEMFEAGIDVHWENAKEVFDLPRNLDYGDDPKHTKCWNHITKGEMSHYDYRRLGKTCVHAANYGMGPIMLQTILAREGFIIPQSLAKQLLEGYLSRNPRLQDWHTRIRDHVRGYRTLISAYDRKRIFFSRFDDKTWRVAYAFSPQNTVGEMIQDSIEATWEKQPYVIPLLNVHDEMDFEFAPHLLPKVIGESRKLFEIQLEINGRELIIPAEYSLGTSWGKLSEMKQSYVDKCSQWRDTV